MTKWTLSRFLRSEMEPYLAGFGFSRNGSEFQIQSPDDVLGWLDFRSSRIQTETVTFMVDVQVTIPAFLPDDLRKQLPLPGPKIKLGAKGFMITRAHVPTGYQSLAVNPVMARKEDLFSFYEDGGAVGECTEAFTRSWEERTWPWLQERLSLDSLSRLRYAPLVEIEKMRTLRDQGTPGGAVSPGDD